MKFSALLTRLARVSREASESYTITMTSGDRIDIGGGACRMNVEEDYLVVETASEGEKPLIIPFHAISNIQQN